MNNLYNMCTEKVACRIGKNAAARAAEIWSQAALRQAAFAAMIVENRMKSARGAPVSAS